MVQHDTNLFHCRSVCSIRLKHQMTHCFEACKCTIFIFYSIHRDFDHGFIPQLLSTNPHAKRNSIHWNKKIQLSNIMSLFLSVTIVLYFMSHSALNTIIISLKSVLCFMTWSLGLSVCVCVCILCQCVCLLSCLWQDNCPISNTILSEHYFHSQEHNNENIS